MQKTHTNRNCAQNMRPARKLWSICVNAVYTLYSFNSFSNQILSDIGLYGFYTPRPE